jgi:hypothetical protein
MKDGRIAVVETAAFISKAKGCMTEAERNAAIDMIAAAPECGVLIEGGGGIRKVRFAIGSRGKSGGVRIVYYYHCQDFPVFLLTVFAKAEKANLTKEQRNVLAIAAKSIAAVYGRVGPWE